MKRFFLLVALLLSPTLNLGHASTPTAGVWLSKSSPVAGKEDVFYKAGPTEISISTGFEETTPLSTVITILVWGDLFSCEYHNDAELINDRGASLHIENEGCAPKGPKGTGFVSKLSPQNLSVLKGAKSLVIRQGNVELPISVEGLDDAIAHLK